MVEAPRQKSKTGNEGSAVNVDEEGARMNDEWVSVGGYTISKSLLVGVEKVSAALAFENDLDRQLIRAALLEAVKRNPRSGVKAGQSHHRAVRSFVDVLMAILRRQQ